MNGRRAANAVLPVHSAIRVLRKGRRRIRTVLDCEASLSRRNARYAWLPKDHPAQGTKQTLSRARGTDHGRRSAVYRCNRGFERRDGVDHLCRRNGRWLLSNNRLDEGVQLSA